MTFDKLLEISQKLLVFNKNTLRALEKDPNALSANIGYWIK